MLYQAHEWSVPKLWRGWMVALVILWLLDGMGKMGWMRGAVVTVVSPLTNVSVGIGAKFSGTWHYLSQWNGLVKRNLDLERQLAEDAVSVHQTAALTLENTQLRQSFGILPRNSWGKVIGKVVLIDPSKYRIWVEQPVSVGSPVLMGDQLIGVVSEIQGRVAEVARVGWGVGQIMVKIDNSGQVANGKIIAAGTELSVTKISLETKINPGMGVTTLGDGQYIPPDLAVATIKEVIAPPEAIYQDLKLGVNDVAAPGDLIWVIKEGQ